MVINFSRKSKMSKKKIKVKGYYKIIKLHVNVNIGKNKYPAKKIVRRWITPHWRILK